MNAGVRVGRILAMLGICMLMGFASVASATVEVAGVKLEETVHVANQDLKLNGAGIRYKVIFKVYVEPPPQENPQIQMIKNPNEEMNVLNPPNRN